MTTAANADAARIIAQLREGHAGMNAAGLGSPALDDFSNLLIEMIAEAPDPKFRLHEIAELLARECGTTAKSA
ncbi:hypothetical protein N7925_15755 [Streptomyces sp. CA-278952]|uniref:hypothetical protein n=1 Tax=Streptomyces sp. CA-278952 TaxID=2980556 RepID=UPI002367BAD4|nr:hypothetical protein [Streptomyces sp. CA-278952]WDG29696.1 hypothetical protein N7925_15755 [Streptomyces sp. CA-278952]